MNDYVINILQEAKQKIENLPFSPAKLNVVYKIETIISKLKQL